MTRVMIKSRRKEKKNKKKKNERNERIVAYLPSELQWIEMPFRPLIERDHGISRRRRLAIRGSSNCHYFPFALREGLPMERKRI